MQSEKTINFIKRAKEVHSETYDYSKSVYDGSILKLIIICPKHGEFLQSPNKHLNGRGCPKCGREKTINAHKHSLESFISKANEIHNNTYDYSLITEFKGVRSKVKIICPEHGVFEQNANSHLNGTKCPICAYILNCKQQVDNRKQTSDFIIEAKEVHGDTYDYSLAEYKTSKDKVKIICSKHGIFEQKPPNHIHLKQGCPKCTGNISKGEKEVLEYIKSVYTGKIIENDRKQIKPKELDIFLPELNLAIEYNGEYWHNKREQDSPGYHLLKEQACIEKGITLYSIWHKDWINNNLIIKSTLLSLLKK